MKKIILISILFIGSHSFAQKKDTNRYFEAAYVGQDSVGHLKYGTYYFAMKNGYFPSMAETKTLIIAAYNLQFSPLDSRLAIWLTEFKNKKEFDKWNKSE